MTIRSQQVCYIINGFLTLQTRGDVVAITDVVCCCLLSSGIVDTPTYYIETIQNL